MHLQFCDTENNQDITSHFGAEQDATEVRAWAPDGTCLAAVTKTPRGRWRVESSDARNITLAHYRKRYATYAAALASLDVDVSAAAPDGYTDACGKGEEEAMFEIIVDGLAWEDTDGSGVFPEYEIPALVAYIEAQGFDNIKVVPA